jgi:copper chaperone CopZ
MMKTRFKWHRLLTNPTTRVESQDAVVTQLRVDGLVCSSVCAVRTKQALEDLSGVERVSVDFDTGIATIHGARHADAAYERAVASVVAGRPLRKLIEHVHQRFRARHGKRGQTAGGLE